MELLRAKLKSNEKSRKQESYSPLDNNNTYIYIGSDLQLKLTVTSLSYSNDNLLGELIKITLLSTESQPVWLKPSIGLPCQFNNTLSV